MCPGILRNIQERRLGYDDIKYPAKRDTLIAGGASDWSVADTSGLLIGWFCIQTDLINLSSCDTFLVNRGRRKMMTSSSDETLQTSHVLLIHLYSKMTLTYSRQTSPCKQGSQETRHRNPMNVQLLYNVIFCFPWPEATLCQVRGFWCTIIQWLTHTLFLLILFHSEAWGVAVSSAHTTDRVIRSKSSSVPDWVPASLSSFTLGARQLELIASAHFQKLNEDFYVCLLLIRSAQVYSLNREILKKTFVSRF